MDGSHSDSDEICRFSLDLLSKQFVQTRRLGYPFASIISCPAPLLRCPRNAVFSRGDGEVFVEECSVNGGLQ